MNTAIGPLERRTLLAASPFTAFTLAAGPTGAATDRAGNLYSTGMFAGRVDFDPNPATQLTLRAFNPNTSPQRSQYVARYTEGGDLVWALPLITDGTGAHPGRTADAGAIAVDRAGNVYVSGHFNGTVDFNPDKNAAFNLTTSTGDGFVLKLDPDGHFLWAAAIPNANPNANLATARTLAFGANTDLFVAGEQTDADFTPYLARLDRATGAVSYVQTLTGFDPQLRTAAGLAADPAGNPIVVGARRDVGGGFALKTDRDANVLWNRTLPGDGGGVTSLVVNNKGHVFLAGEFVNKPVDNDFDPGGGGAFLFSAGQRDAYVVRLNADGEFVWARRLGGAGDDTVRSLTLDNDLSLHLAGTFTGQADFDPRRTQVILDAGPAEDIYVAKWTPTGNFIDAFQIGAKKSRQTTAPAVIATPTNRLLLSTPFAGTVDFDPTVQDLFLDSTTTPNVLVTYPA